MEQVIDEDTVAVIQTNNHKKEMISYYDLPENWQNEFDYLDEDEKVEPRFVWYKSWFWDVIDTMQAPPPFLSYWHRHIPLGWDSMLLIRFKDDDYVIMGYAYTKRNRL